MGSKIPDAHIYVQGLSIVLLRDKPLYDTINISEQTLN